MEQDPPEPQGKGPKMRCPRCGGKFAPAMTPGALGEKRLYLPALLRRGEQGTAPKPAMACIDCGSVKERPVTRLGEVLGFLGNYDTHLSGDEVGRVCLLIRNYWGEHFKTIDRSRPAPDLLKMILQEVGEDLNVRLPLPGGYRGPR